MWTDRRVFQHSVVALWEEDLSRLRPAVMALRSEGTADLRSFLDLHPETVREAVRLTPLIDVNGAALCLFEAASRDLLASRRESDPDAAVLALCRRTILALAEGERMIRFEAAAKTLGGREIHLLVQSDLPAEDDPSPTALVSMVDITDRRRMEKALRDTETRVAETVDFLPDATFAINAEGVVTAWNHAIEEMTGAPSRDMIGKGNYEYAIPFYGVRRPILIDLLRVPNAEIEKKYNLKRDAKRGILIADTCIPDLRGKKVFLWGTASLLVDGGGNVTGAIESIRDVTDRTREQEALRASEERYRFFLESSFDGLAVTENGAFLDVSPQLLGMLGYGSEEMIGRRSTDFIVAEDRDMVRRKIRDLDEQAYESRLVRKDGTLVDVEMRARHFIYRGRKVRFTATRDIGDRRRAEEALRNLQKLDSLATLAGGIAHDFNNQLTGILGNISLAMEGLPQGDERRQLLLEALEASTVARSLTRQLLTFAAGGDPVMQVEDLGRILREQAVFATRGTNVKCLNQGIGSPLPAMVDPQQIRQVVQNLVINAVQAMPQGGTIRVGGSVVEIAEGLVPLLPAGRYVEVTVEDEGVGIPADHLGRIFDPFYSTKAKGRGLGLAVCHSIVGRHKGRISVESAPGKGAVFTVYLPAAPETALPRDGTPVPAEQKRNGTVLVMDDEPFVTRIISRMLHRLGFQVVTVPDGAAALSEYARARDSGAPFALVIMDMTIPGGMGGRETIAKLRDLDPEVRAIVSSGYSESTDYRVIGFRGVLPKPYVLADLQVAVDKAMRDGS